MKRKRKTYAVIKIKGSQYKVSEGQEIFIDKLENAKILNLEVLLFVENGKVKIGKPNLENVKLKLKIIKEEVKGKKIHIQTYKAKSRYRRKKGFRPTYSKLLVEKITSR